MAVMHIFHMIFFSSCESWGKAPFMENRKTWHMP